MPTADAFDQAASRFRAAGDELETLAGLFTIDGITGGNLQQRLEAQASEATAARSALRVRLRDLAEVCSGRATQIRGMEAEWRTYWDEKADFDHKYWKWTVNGDPDKGSFDEDKPSKPPKPPDWADLTVST